MQFSETWLRTLVDPPLTSAELAHLLTMAGLEVESLRPVAPAFSGVVVGHVQSVDRHPNADKLKICRVDTGRGGLLQIVCGAPNVAVGMKAPCATVGAELPGMRIQAAKVRGVESFGMMCSARELGLSDDQSGLLLLPNDAGVGTDVRACLDLDDMVLTLKLTPNRSDCLSVIGVAREVAALTGARFRRPGIEPVQASNRSERRIVLDAPEACPRYLGRVIADVNANAPTPDWMRRRLERSGVRSISAVVDVTNYVMLELGQPLHAFDNTKLVGAVHARFPRIGETILLLNGQTVEPASDTLLIADDARALALAGIMGGEESGITLETTELFLESAFFAPEAVAGKARALGFSSDASYRFERGVDYEGVRVAIERATQLVIDICGGRAGPVSEACAKLPERNPVRLRPSRVNRVLGLSLRPEQIESLLAGLDLACARDADDFIVTPPSYRFDIAIEEDLIEELARMHGYDNIPVPTPSARMGMLPQPEGARGVSALKRILVYRDYQEVINFSFVDVQWERDFAANEAPVVLANPIASQMGVMRSNLIGGLVANLSGNLKRRIDRIRLFEVGRCFVRDRAGDAVAGFLQPTRLGGLCAGTAAGEQWGMPPRPVDFFDVKADVEALLAPFALRFERVNHPALHPGRAASVALGDRSIGFVGELHPRWVQKYELGMAPVVFEVEVDVLLERRLPAFQEPSRFPAVVRDLALVVPQNLAVKTLLDALQEASPSIVQEIRLFDVYYGKGIDPDRKSLAFRVVMQDTERTLADVEVEAAMAALIHAAAEKFTARLRG